MEQYFWQVSFLGWMAVAFAALALRERDRRLAARRRAQMHAVGVALRGVAVSMQAVGPAAARAARSMEQFRESFRRAQPRHK